MWNSISQKLFFVTSKYRQILRPNYRMSAAVSSIVEVSIDKLALSISVCVSDWTAELAIIASNAIATISTL